MVARVMDETLAERVISLKKAMDFFNNQYDQEENYDARKRERSTTKQRAKLTFIYNN